MAKKTARDILRGKCISDDSMEQALKELWGLLPKKQKPSKYQNDYEEGHVDGWNDCLEMVSEVMI